jgi:ATP-dependent DNA helicase RecQ
VTAEPRHVLRTVFGFPEFRGAQEEIVRHVIAGGDALVLMPTGAGKSLCYQVPAMCRPGVGVVVSPLIALMQDQVLALRQVGARAAFLNSSLSPGDARAVERDVARGALDLVYVAPERLLMPAFQALLQQTPLALFAIDEAHCVSQWGHDFRPEYMQLSVLAEKFPGVPRVALTATADGPTRREIADRLALRSARVFATGFDRPNIRYRVVVKQNAVAQLSAFLDAEHDGDAGIVYCLSRANVEEVARRLAGTGRVALPYHAGLDARTRERHQTRFVHEEGVIVVATVAFGMGIDKPNVRFVAHVDLPKSLEQYYQETGRAGRDGLPADAWLAYGLTDVVALRQMLLASDADEAHKRIENHRLEAMLGFCETTACRRGVLLAHFDERLDGPCGNCDTCLEPVATWDGTREAQMALSCVYRTGQRFGAGHLVDVLVGKRTEKVARFGHDRVSTFGIGGELSSGAWRSVYRQLVAAGLLAVDIEGHGGLHLTPESRAVLKGSRPVRLRHDPAATAGGRRARDRRGAARGADRAPDSALWEALRARRLTLAREQGVPPYVIFHDSTLLEMAQRRPRRLDDLALIPGVGEAKLARYGAAFLEVLTAGAPEAVE